MPEERAAIRRWINRPEGSNWGDFGADDQIGRMNLLTPARRLAAAREIREGIAFVLSLPLDYPGGSLLDSHRHAPKRRSDAYNRPMGDLFPGTQDVVCDDYVEMYTQYSTQWDSFAHFGQMFDADGDGEPEVVYYNGYRGGQHIVGPEHADGPCAKALGIENFACTGAQGRGVLVDLHSIYGNEPVAVGYDALMRAFEQQGVSPEPGDFLLIHTGFDQLLMSMNKQPERDLLLRSCAGLDGSDPRLLQWITESGVVALISDNMGVESFAFGRMPQGSHTALPLHEHCLFKQGIHLGELWWLKDLADWLLAHRRSAFMLTAPPLRLPGVVGSPATPVATV